VVTVEPAGREENCAARCIAALNVHARDLVRVGEWRGRRGVSSCARSPTIADALPTTVEEVVLTGSVARDVANDVSDTKMLIVTGGELDLEHCFALAAASGEPSSRVTSRRLPTP